MRWLAVALSSSLLAASAGCDPVHSDAVASLGPEQGDVRKGPEHRPGQPCLVCHGGSGPGGARFGVAGTVFASEASPTAVSNIVVHLKDATGAEHDVTTNAAGNFYTDWQPTYPLRVELRPEGGDPVVMRTSIGRDGSCGGCHLATKGPRSAGRVVLAIETDAAVPPRKDAGR